MKINTISCGCWCREDIVEYLHKNAALNIVKHFSHPQMSDIVTGATGNFNKGKKIYSRFHDAAVIQNFRYRMSPQMLKNFHAQYFDLFYANLGRSVEGRGGIVPYSETIHSFRWINNYIYNLFLSNNIQLVLFSHLPHEVVDTMAESVAHFLGIPVRILETPPYTAGFFFSYNSSSEHGLYKHMKPVREVNSSDLSTFVYNSDYLSDKNEWRDLLSSLSHRYLAARVHFSNPLMYANAVYHKRYQQNLANMIQPESKIPDKFVYMPLHYQPEASTISYGDIMWEDQAFCIEELSQALPPEYVIVVKEHPVQHATWRPPLFFDRLAEIKNLMFVSPMLDSHSLVQKAAALATISGTAGWEALNYGKPVIYFGYPNYREMPGVFKYTDDLDIDFVLNYKVDRKEVEKAISNWLSCAYSGVIRGEVENPDENLRITTGAIQEVINEMNTTSPGWQHKVSAKIEELKVRTQLKEYVLPEGFTPPPLRKEFVIPKWLRGLNKLFWVIATRLYLKKKFKIKIRPF